MRVAAAGIVAAMLLAAGTARGAAADPYLHRFAATWTGGGTASLNLHLPSFRVACRLAASESGDSVELKGLCRLRLLSLLSKSIDTRLRHDAASDGYAGSYSVDGGPPAILRGRREGDDLRLDVTWPIPVNGHLKAVIRIANDGHGHFTLRTVDPLGLYGAPMTTSDLAFTPK